MIGSATTAAWTFVATCISEVYERKMWTLRPLDVA